MSNETRDDIFSKVTIGFLSIAPPAVTSVAAWDFIKSHPLIALIAGLGYVAILATGRFCAKVLARLEPAWVERAANYIDLQFASGLDGSRRRYNRYVYATYHDLDFKGLTTRGAFALDKETVYVDLSLAPALLREKLASGLH